MLKLDLKGRIVLLTGATGDLGRVMARSFARCGARVAIHYHTDEGMARQLAEETGGLTVQADVCERESVDRMRNRVLSDLGVPDVIVANAVVQYSWTSVLQQSEADYISQFRSCVLQSVFLSQAFLPPLIEEIGSGQKGGGRYIAINSECAMQCFESQSAYAAGKRGLDGLMRVLAREVGGHAITVNQIAPGWMVSDRDRAGKSASSAGYEANVPLRRRGEDQDVANLAVYLASDLAEFITGAYIPVCGGNVMPAI